MFAHAYREGVDSHDNQAGTYPPWLLVGGDSTDRVTAGSGFGQKKVSDPKVGSDSYD